MIRLKAVSEKIMKGIFMYFSCFGTALLTR